VVKDVEGFEVEEVDKEMHAPPKSALGVSSDTNCTYPHYNLVSIGAIQDQCHSPDTFPRYYIYLPGSHNRRLT
jgi:hypothetical protein